LVAEELVTPTGDWFSSPVTAGSALQRRQQASSVRGRQIDEAFHYTTDGMDINEI
jgi:hypothetical protein